MKEKKIRKQITVGKDTIAFYEGIGEGNLSQGLVVARVLIEKTTIKGQKNA